jgi:hypothetical protein
MKLASIGGKDFSPEIRSAEAAGVERQQMAARLDQLAL